MRSQSASMPQGGTYQAEQNFDKCFKLTAKTKYLDAKARVKARREELKKLKKQMRDEAPQS